MKRFLLLAVVLLFSAASLSGLDNKYDKYFSFKLTPQFEIANGLIQEYQKMIKTLNERIERLRKELEEAQNGGKEGTKQSDNQ